MYISTNSNIGMATLLQQNKNCMKTLPNGRGGNIIVGNKVIGSTTGGGLVQVATQQVATSSTLTPATSAAGFSNSFVLPTQTIVFTNGGQPGANSILSYPQLVQQQQQQPQQTRVLMQQEMVSLPIGSIVQTSGGTYALVQGPRQDNKAMSQSSFLVGATAGTAAGTTNIITTSSASSFQQQFQQQLATTSNNGNTPTTTRYFSQFSQQPATNSSNATPTLISASNNRPQVLINRANNTIIAGNTTQRLQHTAILKKTPPKIVTIASTAGGSQQSQQIVRMQSIAAHQVQMQPQRPQTHQVRPQLQQQRPQVVLQRAPLVLQRPQVVLQRPQTQQLQQQQPQQAQQKNQQPQQQLPKAQQQQSSQQQQTPVQQQQQPQQQQQTPMQPQEQSQQQQQQHQSHYGASTMQKIRQQQFQQEQVSTSAAATHAAVTSTTNTPPTVMNGAPASTPTATYAVPNGNVDPAAGATSNTNGATSNNSADDDLEPEVDIVINNVVCSFSVRCHLNLRDIALQGANVEYRRENGMVTMKLRRPYTTASIWSSGRITCTGATSEPQSKIAARRYARTLEKLGFHVRFQNFRIVNVLGTCSMPWAIRITGFSEKYKKDASYEPELHPGVTYKLRTPKATLKIFSTGSITVTAASVANVQAAIEHIYPLVFEFRKKRSPQEAEHMRQKQLMRAEMIEIDMSRNATAFPCDSAANVLKRKRTFAADNSVQKRRRSRTASEGSDTNIEDIADDDEVIFGDYDDIDQMIEGPDDDE